MKVIYTTTVPAPYKVEMFEELGKLCDLTVVFEKKKLTYREDRWMRNDFKNFKAIFLDGVDFKDSIISTGIIKTIKSERFDAIIIGVYSTPSAMLAIEYMKMKNIQYILSSDGGFIKKDNCLSKVIKKRYIGAASAWLSTGVVTSEYLYHYGADKNNIFVYPFSSIKKSDVLEKSISKVEKTKKKSKIGIPEEYCVVSVGQFIHRKGFDLLLAACKDIPRNIGFYIIGGVPTEEYIEMKEKYKLSNVHFIEFKTKKELADYYMAGDLFVLPTREDIWGLVVNEAMAYGLPVVTTDKCIAGLEMIKEGITGSIIHINDVKSLKEQIVYWIEKKNTDSQAILTMARKYTIESMARRHIEILNAIKGDKIKEVLPALKTDLR